MVHDLKEQAFSIDETLEALRIVVGACPKGRRVGVGGGEVRGAGPAETCRDLPRPRREGEGGGCRCAQQGLPRILKLRWDGTMGVVHPFTGEVRSSRR